MRFFHWILLAAFAAVVPAFVAQGCGGGKGDDTATDADADTDSDTVEDSTDSYDGPNEWVVDDLAIGDEDTGYDLDEHETTERDDPVGCGKIDGQGGVDNQLGPLLEGIATLVGGDFDADTLLDDSIADGSILLLLRALQLDHSPSDADVDVFFFLGEDADADLLNNFGGQGQFLVDPRSLTDPEDKGTPLISFMDANVADGFFHGGPSDFNLTIPIQDTAVLAITISETQIEWDFEGDGSLANGVLGGYVSIGEITRALREVEIADLNPEDIEGLVTTVLAGQADIDVIPPGDTGQTCADDPDCAPGQTCEKTHCMEAPDACDALSIGITFTAVPAEIMGIAVGGDSDTDTDADTDSDTDTDTDTGTDTGT